MLKRNGGDLEIVRPDRLSLQLERTTDLSAFRRTGVIERSDENGARNTSSFACSRRGSELDSAPWRSSYTTTEQRTMSVTFVDCQRAIRRGCF